MKKLTKGKQKELKELSKKYFWEQKINEVLLFILIAGLIIVALFMSGSIMNILYPSDFINVPLLVAGILGLMFFAFIGFLVFSIFYALYILLSEWIESNKEKAERRAKDELGIEPNEWGNY